MFHRPILYLAPFCMLPCPFKMHHSDSQKVQAQYRKRINEPLRHRPDSQGIEEYTARMETPLPGYTDPDTEEDIVYRITPGRQVTEDLLQICATNFSKYYGLWGKEAILRIGPWARKGKPVQMSSARLRAQSLPEDTNNILVCAVTKGGNGNIIGHVFVSQWEFEGHRVWWATQLVVVPEYRNERKATRMFQALVMHYDIGKTRKKDFVGVLSSHPFTICAVLRVFGRGIEALPSADNARALREPETFSHLPVDRRRCRAIIKSAPVNYVNKAVWPKSLTSKESYIPTYAKTAFYIDHTEPLLAVKLAEYGVSKMHRREWKWPFGALEAGCEFVTVMEYKYDPTYEVIPGFPGRDVIDVLTMPFCGPQHPGKWHLSSERYAQIDRFLRDSRGPFEELRPHLLLAKRIMESEGKAVVQCLDHEVVPEPLKEAYKWFGLPEVIETWAELKRWAASYLDEENVAARLLTLQALHYAEVKGISLEWKAVDRVDSLGGDDGRVSHQTR